MYVLTLHPILTTSLWALRAFPLKRVVPTSIKQTLGFERRMVHFDTNSESIATDAYASYSLTHQRKDFFSIKNVSILIKGLGDTVLKYQGTVVWTIQDHSNGKRCLSWRILPSACCHHNIRRNTPSKHTVDPIQLQTRNK